MRSLRSRMIPWIAFVVVAGLGISHWSMIENAHRDRFVLETEVVAEQVHHRLEAHIAARMAFLASLSDHWSSEYHNDHNAYRHDARNVYERLPGFQAINWVDASGVIRVIVPESGNEAALGKRLHEHPHEAVRSAIRRAASERRVTRTSSVVEFYQGGRGFAVYWPLFDADGASQGYINGVFRVNELVDQCLAEAKLRERFRLEIKGEDGLLAYGEPGETAEDWPYATTAVIDVVDRPWVLHIAPSELYLSAGSVVTRWGIPIASVVLALVIALLLETMLERQVEQRNNERRVRMLLESTAEGIYGLDNNGLCTFCNPASLRMLGYERPEDLLGRRVHDLIHHAREDESPHDEADCRVYDAFRNGTGVHIEGEALWRSDGTSFTAEIRSYPIMDCGVTEGAVVTFTDMTQRREVEEERHVLEAQFYEAERMRSLGLLGGGIAHDFNNLLVGIMGNASLAAEDLPANSPVRESIRAIEVSANRAAELTSQLLAYSGRGRFNVQRVDLCELVAEMDNLLGVTIPKAIRVERECVVETAPVEADVTQIRQVVMNLITNAADAIGDASGEIVIRTTGFEGDPADLPGHGFGTECPEGRYFCLEIRDNGCGMDDTTISHVFDPFFTTKFTGRGLGLAAVLGIISGHGGTIRVSSREGVGTSFLVLLPESVGAVEPVDGQPAVDIVSHGPDAGLVLVVDDDSAVRGFARTVLERNGSRVITATSGRHGVEEFATHHEELTAVLLDLTMPGMDGDEAFRAMHAMNPNVPVILTSGYDSQQTADQFAGLGFAAFLKKPFRPADLVGLIREATRKPG